LTLSQRQAVREGKRAERTTQYPEDTSFTLDVGSLDAQLAGPIVAGILTFGRSHRIHVKYGR
jgi:hypothetical protein